ncbi:uncharacterized protein LOC144487450 [Mustelus asterias]
MALLDKLPVLKPRSSNAVFWERLKEIQVCHRLHNRDVTGRVRTKMPENYWLRLQAAHQDGSWCADLTTNAQQQVQDFLAFKADSDQQHLLCTFWKKRREHVPFCSTEQTLDQKMTLEASEAKSEACRLFTSQRSSLTPTPNDCRWRPSGPQAPDTAPIHPGNESSDESSEDMGEGTSEGGTVYPSASTSQTTIAETDTSVGPRLPDQLSICSLFLFGLHQYSDELCDCPFSPGSSTIPETVVPVRRCSTHATGWLRGSHPSLREGIVKRTVCFHWSGNTCRWHQEIKIKRCSNFFVYELKKPRVCSLAYCTVSKSFDPCVKHRVLNQPWRSTNCVGNLCSDSVQCDQSLVLGWYRFKSPGSSTIPETVVPVRRCSTHATGWLKGSHPSLREGIVKRTVCFHWSGNTCRWHQEIKIKRCYNFFVYELKKSPACSLAYCTEAGPVPTQPPTPQTSPPYDSPHWNVTAASGIGGTQIKLVIKFMGHVGVEVMQNIILELQLSLKNRFPDVDLHLSIADD